MHQACYLLLRNPLASLPELQSIAPSSSWQSRLMDPQGSPTWPCRGNSMAHPPLQLTISVQIDLWNEYNEQILGGVTCDSI